MWTGLGRLQIRMHLQQSLRSMSLRRVWWWGSIKRSSSAAAITAAKFFMLNYVAISQMAMVTAGLASARATSALGIETSSVVIGSIPLITSCVLLLHNATNIVKLPWRKFCRRQRETGPRRTRRDSFY